MTHSTQDNEDTHRMQHTQRTSRTQRTQRAWLMAALVLVAALVLAACAGHAWASPAAIYHALAGDDSLRSRLLLQWRLP